MSDAQLRLDAMLDKVKALICSTPVEADQSVFDELDAFSRAASQEKARRSKRQTDFTLEELLSMADNEKVVGATPRAPPEKILKKEPDEWSLLTGSDLSAGLETCLDCLQQRSLDHVCHQCGMIYCWRCSGYNDAPVPDPVHPSTGDVIKLRWFCGHCFRKKSVDASSVSGQVEEYARLLAYFSSPTCLWRWIPCICDGYSIFSVVWVALEGFKFRDSLFYCQAGTERDTQALRCDPLFLSFVQECSGIALRELSSQAVKDEDRIRKWIALQNAPHVAPKLDASELQLTWEAVAANLNRDAPTRVVLRKFFEDRLVFSQRFGCKKGLQKRTINVLQWSEGLGPRFDLLLRQDVVFE